MSLYPAYQFQWQDSTGQHLFVSEYPGAFQAAMTLAISMQAIHSATAIKIVECGTNDSPTANRGIYYRERFSWGEWK